MGTAASSSLRGSSVPGLPLMVLGGLLHRSRSWRGAVLTLHSLVGLLYRLIVASHLPLASGSPRHQSTPSERQSLSWGGSLRPYNHTHKKPGLNRLYCGGVSECTMSKNLTRPVGFDHVPPPSMNPTSSSDHSTIEWLRDRLWLGRGVRNSIV